MSVQLIEAPRKRAHTETVGEQTFQARITNLGQTTSTEVAGKEESEESNNKN
jgi:hypothetical protein